MLKEHFEDSQFEQHRADGRRLLKPNAVPTIFSVPNPPKLLDTTRKSTYKVIIIFCHIICIINYITTFFVETFRQCKLFTSETLQN